MAHAQEDVPMTLFPLWDQSLSVRTGFGYRDNVLLSHSRPQSSAFFSAGLEASAFRLAEDGTQLSFLCSVDDNHFFSVPQFDDELLALAQVQLKKPFASDWQATFAVEYIFQKEVLDVSATEVDLRTIEVQAHNVQFTPAIRRKMGESNYLELGVPFARRIYLDPLDSLWEGGPRLTFGHTYGNKSEWTVGYGFVDRIYDTRTETTDTGAGIRGTALEFYQHKFEIGSSHYWDKAERWRTLTKLGYRINNDSGSGHFDYGRFQISEQLRFRTKKLELMAEVRFGHYQFATQTVSASDTSKRELSDLTWHLRAEREVVKHCKVYLAFEQEHSFSNQPIERYRVNTVNGGCIVEF